MSGTMSKAKSKGGRGKPRGPVLYLRIDPQLESALQSFIEKQRIRPDKTAVVTTALQELLEREGFWPPPITSTENPD